MTENTDIFEGFQNGTYTKLYLPPGFIDNALTIIDDLAELKLVLFCFWALSQKEGDYPYLQRQDFTNYPPFMQGLEASAPDTPPEDTLETSLARAIQHGILLSVKIELKLEPELLYFVNTEKGRTAVSQIAKGEWQWDDLDSPVQILPERPNIYKLYEADFGPLTPMIGDVLKDMEQSYPIVWIDEALREAVKSNKRNLRYVQAILKRWQDEGKTIRGTTQQRPEQDHKPSSAGRYADFIER